MQAKLLRVLEEGEVERVGGDKLFCRCSVVVTTEIWIAVRMES
jgi:transcriptional regulator with GAF, ATPase, and Fis domain